MSEAIAADDIGTCEACGRPIRHGRAYMPRIPFVGSWGGFSHQFCPPRITTTPTPTERESAEE